MLWLICRSVVGWIWWCFIPIRKRLAIQNYQTCFPKRPVQELRQSVGECITQYIFAVLGTRAQISMPPELSNGGICIAGHGSAWDIALISLAEQVPITIFLRRPSGFWSARFIEYLRQTGDIEALYGRDCMEKAYRSLEAGRVIIFVQDQRHNDGIETEFFGSPCLTSAAFASMAYNTRRPIFGAWQSNIGANIHVAIQRLHWDIPSNREQAIRVLTQQTQTFYQTMITQKPYSWLWLHDRWKIPAKP